MAIIKPREIHGMSDKDIGKRLAELKLELAKNRGQIAVGGSASNPGRVRELRKTIARLLTKRNAKTTVTKEKNKGGHETGRSV